MRLEQGSASMVSCRCFVPAQFLRDVPVPMNDLECIFTRVDDASASWEGREAGAAKGLRCVSWPFIHVGPFPVTLVESLCVSERAREHKVAPEQQRLSRSPQALKPTGLCVHDKREDFYLPFSLCIHGAPTLSDVPYRPREFRGAARGNCTLDLEPYRFHAPSVFISVKLTCDYKLILQIWRVNSRLYLDDPDWKFTNVRRIETKIQTYRMNELKSEEKNPQTQEATRFIWKLCNSRDISRFERGDTLECFLLHPGLSRAVT